MELLKQNRGVLLFFPMAENATRRATPEGCQECDRFEAAYQAAIEAIQQAIRGPETLGEKVTKMHVKQEERDRVLREQYAHKVKAHPRNSA